MRHSWVTLVCCIIYIGLSGCQAVNLTFPDNFIIGAATASYQIEGAWNTSGKGESSWDYFTHNYPDSILDGTNADVTCDSYHKYKEDVKWLKDIGLDYYRFSFSWSRILPNGFANEINEDGIEYYTNLINELLDNDITPFVTLYHWDHPQALEELGGWTNELMVDWFADYARIVFTKFGHLVKNFITINEPNVACQEGYNATKKAPGKELENMGHYLCLHNMLKAHAEAFHMYDEEFRPTQEGQIGWTVQCPGMVEGDGTTEESMNRLFQFWCGWMSHPIFIGDYPEIVKERVANVSAMQGYPFSRLPEFTEYWINRIKGSADFFGLNHYTSTVPVFDADNSTEDSGLLYIYPESWIVASAPWLRVIPEGFGNVLRKIRDEYDNPTVYIFENGYADDGEINDYDRIAYFYDYLTELLTAIKEDGCNVVAYTIWSLMDNFEWEFGYTAHFGIVSIDYDSDDRTRSAKLSTSWWQEVLRTRVVQEVPTANSEL